MGAPSVCHGEVLSVPLDAQQEHLFHALSAGDGARRHAQPPAVLLQGVELDLLVNPAFRSEVAGVERLELERIGVEGERIVLRDLFADEERVLEVYGIRRHFARGFLGHERRIELVHQRHQQLIANGTGDRVRR